MSQLFTRFPKRRGGSWRAVRAGKAGGKPAGAGQRGDRRAGKRSWGDPGGGMPAVAALHLADGAAAPARLAVPGVHGPSSRVREPGGAAVPARAGLRGRRDRRGVAAVPAAGRDHSRVAEHIPDFLAVTGSGAHLVDVRPRELIRDDDRVLFAAAAEAALAAGWRSRWSAAGART